MPKSFGCHIHSVPGTHYCLFSVWEICRIEYCVEGHVVQHPIAPSHRGNKVVAGKTQ